MTLAGARLHIFLASVGLVLGAVFAAGVYLQPRLIAELEETTWSDLTHHAQTALLAVDRYTAGPKGPIVAGLGTATDKRITLVGPQGRVLADSLATSRGRDLSDRPELREALSGRPARARRHSEGMGTEMLFVALPRGPHAAEGALRVGVEAARIDAAVDSLRSFLLLAALVGLAFAIVMSVLVSALFGRTLRRIVLRVQARAGARTGDLEGPHDDIAGLLSSVDRLAITMERSVADLATERMRIEAVLETLGEGVIATDGRGLLATTNAAARSLLGLDEGSLGRPLIEVARAPELHALVDSGGGQSELELPGPPRRVLVASCGPMEGRAGVVVVLRDVTELRALEAMRRDFVANVSHEIRTPVSVIRANAETLLDGALDDRDAAERFLGAIHRHAERLVRLVSDLLDLSRIEAGHQDLSPRPWSVADAVRRVLSGLADSLAERPVEVSVDAELRVLADVVAFEQILVNLVDNAAKYTPAGGAIHIRASPDSEHVVIEVADEGPGLTVEQRQRVFERFYRVDKGRSRDQGGTGLGLAIVKHLADAMGGEVLALPREPQGTIFRVRLPAG